MKKKLLALLLASSMALMNVAPAYGTDIFTDPDNAVNEDIISVPEELDNNGEFNDTEDEFTSEQTDDDFFSDEKEMPSVQEGDTLVANAGQGITAGTSTYSSKSSFGRRKALSQLQGMGINSGSYSWNWANPEYTSGSIPQSLNTLGCTIPHPNISIHPDPLQKRQPFPPHLKHDTSTSALGSVNGK